MKLINLLLSPIIALTIIFVVLVSPMVVQASHEGEVCTPPPPGSPPGSPICAESSPPISCIEQPSMCYGDGNYVGSCPQPCLEVEFIACSNGGVTVCRKYEEFSAEKIASCLQPPENPIPVNIIPACGGDCNPVGNQCPLSCPICATPGGGETYRCVSAPPPTEPPVATPTTVPACNTSCNGNFQCQGAKDGCTACINNKCSVPPTSVPTATPTSVPACNSACTTPSSCQGARDGCTACIDNKCTVPPTAVPTATPTSVPACNSACTTPASCQGAKDGCTYCNPTTDKCEAQPTATPIPTATATPTPSPTPLPFDESMCSCDGLSYGQNPTLGAPLSVTGYGKVLGINKNYAKIPTMKFAFYKTTSGSQVEVLDQTTVNTTIAEETAEKVRYQGQWTINIPSNLEKGVNYRVKATPVCSRKSAAIFNSTPNRVVLAVEDEKPKGLFDRFISFVLSIFGGGSSSNKTPQAVSTQNQGATPTLTEQQRRNLGLETFTPAKEVALEVDPADNCTFLRFKF